MTADRQAHATESPGPGEAGAALREAVERRGSLSGTVQAVAWAFFGVRKGSDHERDIGRLNPVHVIAAGLIGAAAFVGALVVIVRWVVGSGVAA